MADRIQNYRNHARNFPLFHFVALPILTLNLLNAARHVYMFKNRAAVFEVVVAFGILALAFAARVMALTVQDRVIRLEMQLRLARVLPVDLQARAATLTPRQLVALRFASDQEMTDLVRDVCEGRVTTSKEIKMRVKNWQADWLRA